MAHGGRPVFPLRHRRSAPPSVRCDVGQREDGAETEQLAVEVRLRHISVVQVHAARFEERPRCEEGVGAREE
jgi:hypothetical protein